MCKKIFLKIYGTYFIMTAFDLYSFVDVTLNTICTLILILRKMFITLIPEMLLNDLNTEITSKITTVFFNSWENYKGKLSISLKIVHILLSEIRSQSNTKTISKHNQRLKHLEVKSCFSGGTAILFNYSYVSFTFYQTLVWWKEAFLLKCCNFYRTHH